MHGCLKAFLIGLVVLVVLGILGGIGSAIACYVCVDAIGGTLVPGLTQTFTLGPDSDTTDIGGSERPYKDFAFSNDAGGTFTVSMNSIGGGDPYLQVLQDGNEVVSDDDGGMGNNAQLELTAEAGTDYVIRAANYNALDSVTTFTVSLRSGGAGGATTTGTGTTGTTGTPTPPTGTPTPPTGTAGGGGCDALAACCGANPGSTAPAAAATCGQLETYRGIGDQACSTALQGLRAAVQASGQSLPSECN